MKKTITIKGIFNDFLTGYNDKEDSMTLEVDTDECTCHEQEWYEKFSKCGICRLIDKYDTE